MEQHTVPNHTRSQPGTRPLTTTEAAEHLGVKPGTLEVWRVQGKGPTYLKLGRSVRYRMADLDAYMADAARVSTSQG